MKTDDLISAIVADGVACRPSLSIRLVVALGVGGAIAVILFGLSLGIRADIATALQTWRFLLKMAVVVTCFAVALWTCIQLARPDAKLRSALVPLTAAPALLVAAATYELLTHSPDQWGTLAVGSNARFCLMALPLLSLAPLAALLAALRAGAPTSPRTAGAVAGVLAGALAATLYATHCFDDSPLFVALCYTPAISFAAALGAAAGPRVLRW